MKWLKFTVKATGPQRRRGFVGKTGVFNCSENSLSGQRAVEPHLGGPASFICICRGLCFEVLGAPGAAEWGAGLRFLKQMLEFWAFLMSLSCLSLQGSPVQGERRKWTAPPSVCPCPGEFQRSPSGLLEFFQTQHLLLIFQIFRWWLVRGVTSAFPQGLPTGVPCSPYSLGLFPLRGLGTHWSSATCSVGQPTVASQAPPPPLYLGFLRRLSYLQFTMQSNSTLKHPSALGPPLQIQSTLGFHCAGELAGAGKLPSFLPPQVSQSAQRLTFPPTRTSHLQTWTWGRDTVGFNFENFFPSHS